MKVERLTYNVKRGRAKDLVALILEDVKRFPPPHGFRVYSAEAAHTDLVALELEYENHAERANMWDEWMRAPGTDEFTRKYDELVERGGTREFWIVEE